MLQHTEALNASARSPGVHVRVIARDLGLSPLRAERLADYLVYQGYLSYSRPGIEVVLTSRGLDRLSAGADRRRSVRPRFPSTPGSRPAGHRRGTDDRDEPASARGRLRATE